MADINLYGALTPREAGKAQKELLKRALPGIVTEPFLQLKVLGEKNTGTMIFRRYNRVSPPTVPLGEGVTPDATLVTYTDVTMTLNQYGAWIPYSDKLEQLHPDDVVSEFQDILGEAMVELVEVLNIAFLKAGTTVYYANGTARTDVNTFTTVGQIKKVVRFLRDQKASPITNIVQATPKYATRPVAASFVALCDTDCVADLQALPGWKDVEEYADSNQRLNDYEVGAVANVRFIATSLFDAWTDGGGAAGSMITTSATSADVYPIIVLGKDAAAALSLRGKFNGRPIVVPTTPAKGDELGQRGSVGFKLWHSGGILQVLTWQESKWLVR